MLRPKPKAILFDRDGALLIEPPDARVDHMYEVQVFPESIEALRRIATSDYLCFIVTNQAGIEEGLLSEEKFHQINRRMMELLSPSGITFEKIYFSPDAAGSDSPRRKPNTGMLDELLAEYDIDVKESWMVGDRDSDIEFGKRGGLKTILINRADGLSHAHENHSSPDHTVQNLGELADIVLAK